MKKILVVLLSVLIVFSGFVAAYAEEVPEGTEDPIGIVPDQPNYLAKTFHINAPNYGQFEIGNATVSLHLDIYGNCKYNTSTGTIYDPVVTWPGASCTDLSGSDTYVSSAVVTNCYVSGNDVYVTLRVTFYSQSQNISEQRNVTAHSNGTSF